MFPVDQPTPTEPAEPAEDEPPIGVPPTPEHTEKRTASVGQSVMWFDHFDKGHDVGMRHEDGRLFSATCHDCGVVYNHPDAEDVTT